MTQTVEFASDREQYQMQDMHGKMVCFVTADEARDLLKQKFATTFGTKKKVHGIRLLVALSRLTGNGGGQRSLTLAIYGGSRFIFRQKISTERGVSSTYRLKKLDVTESPEWALKRILTPPALESATYQPWYATDKAERESNPAHARRKAASAAFRLPISARVSGRAATA